MVASRSPLQMPATEACFAQVYFQQGNTEAVFVKLPTRRLKTPGTTIAYEANSSPSYEYLHDTHSIALS